MSFLNFQVKQLLTYNFFKKTFFLRLEKISIFCVCSDEYFAIKFDLKNKSVKLF